VLVKSGSPANRAPEEPTRHLQRVLVVDDEERLRSVLVRILGQEGIQADSAPDGSSAVSMTVSGSYDLVVLDLLMPGTNGLNVLSEIMNRRPEQTVLVLSCVSDPESKMAALGLGADDYITKPFHVGELVARVQARLRAASRTGPAVLSCASLKLDVLRQQADSGSGPVSITSRECQLLWELMREPGAVVSKEELLARIWASDPGCASNVVDVYVRRLRSRLGHDVIATVRGSGYCVRTV
jgi:DNA-binding response OmpR family regulator